MEPKRYGVKFADGTEVVSLMSDDKYGWSFLLKTKRQEVECRVTPSGLIRVGIPRKAGPITADGVSTEEKPRCVECGCEVAEVGLCGECSCEDDCAIW